MDIPGDAISKTPKVAFSKQDYRHNPTREERSISQMMEDLGDHRIVSLPLSGARVFGTAPAPNPERGRAQNSQPALEGDHVEAWAALFDPSLVIERNDGLGEGQSYRLGPNYLPIAEPKGKYPPKGYHFRPGSDPNSGRLPTQGPLPGPPGPGAADDTQIPPSDRGRTIRSLISRTGFQIRSDPSRVTPPTVSQYPRKAFRGGAPGHGIPRRKVIWHTGNLMTANQDFYDYIQPKIGGHKSTDPPAPEMETGESRNIQLTLKPCTTPNVLRKTDSPQSVDNAFNKVGSEKFAEVASTTIPGINGAEARQELASQSVVAEGEKIANQEASGISQAASQFVPRASSDSGKNLSTVPDVGSPRSRKNNPEPQPHFSLQTVFEWLEREVQLTARALLGCSFDSHDYEIKEIFNKTRLKTLTDRIDAADNLLSEEMAKMYQFKTSLEDIKSRSSKMADDFLKTQMEHDEFVTKQKRVAETEAGKKAAEEFSLKNGLEKQRQVELQREKLLQEEQRLDEKQRLEKQSQEEKLREEKLEEKHQEEKLQEEKRREEKRQEEKRREEECREEKRREEECREEKRQEEKRRGEQRQEELRKEKLRLGAERLEEQRLERQRREKQRIEKRQQEGELLGDDQPQKERQRGLDRLRYEKQQLVEKQRLDKLLNDERIKAEQMEVRRLAAQRTEGQLPGGRQERKHAQNEAEEMLTRERLGGGKELGINGLDEYPDPYGRGRIEAENAHEKFREITQVRAGPSGSGSLSQTSLKEVPHSVGAQLVGKGETEIKVPKESGDPDDGRSNPLLFPYKLHLQLTPLFNIPSITAWVGRLSDPTVEIEKAIRKHLSDEEMNVLKKVEAYKQFLTRATDHHTRKLAKDSK
ncbi:unnamed protein product [Tuber aestivum]|uniref:Uncharacterized protein n=1 Tax=Tuber aestivum TaxID=59557 RepID=A0A292Q6U3_9PEZI|nr:unnamed protein product [Tuber aestivum]